MHTQFDPHSQSLRAGSEPIEALPIPKAVEDHVGDYLNLKDKESLGTTDKESRRRYKEKSYTVTMTMTKFEYDEWQLFKKSGLQEQLYEMIKTRDRWKPSNGSFWSITGHTSQNGYNPVLGYESNGRTLFELLLLVHSVAETDGLGGNSYYVDVVASTQLLHDDLNKEPYPIQTLIGMENFYNKDGRLVFEEYGPVTEGYVLQNGYDGDENVLLGDFELPPKPSSKEEFKEGLLGVAIPELSIGWAASYSTMIIFEDYKLNDQNEVTLMEYPDEEPMDLEGFD